MAGTVGTDPQGGLAGRSAEVDQLRSAPQVAGGTGRVLVVVAEAGSGKTGVVAARLADVDEHGVWIFEGATDELEQRRPCGVIADCLATGRSATERGRATVAGGCVRRSSSLLSRRSAPEPGLPGGRGPVPR